MAVGKRKPTGEAISEPTLTFTDADPRHDLAAPFSMNQPVAQTTKQRSIPERSRTDPNRPSTSGYHHQSPGSRSRTHTDPSAPSGFDFQLVDEPMPRMMSPTEMGGSTSIGMAIGSPGVAPWDVNRGLAKPFSPQQPISSTTIYVGDEDGNVACKVKASKWKKIGGMFRAKNAMNRQQDTDNFYQLQQQPLEYSPPSRRKRGNTKGSGDGRPELFTSHSSPEGVNGRVPLINYDYVKGGLEQFPTVPAKDLRYDNGRLLLNVDIPAVELERYSIMFSSVLGKKGDRRTILDRRSRVLEMLDLPGDSEAPPLPNATDGLPSPKRRATSPAPSKTASFSLFPATPPVTKQSKLLGATILPPSSLQRSYTAPSALSPLFDTFDQQQIGCAIGSPAQTTASTQGPRWGADESPTSPRSSTSSLDQGDIFFDMKVLDPSRDTADLQYEMITPTKERIAALGDPKPKKSKLSEVTMSIDTEAANAQIEERQLMQNEDALAALEAPPPEPKHDETSPEFAASRSKIDAIMKGNATAAPPPPVAKAETKPKPEPKQELKPEPRIQPKIEVKVESKIPVGARSLAGPVKPLKALPTPMVHSQDPRVPPELSVKIPFGNPPRSQSRSPISPNDRSPVAGIPFGNPSRSQSPVSQRLVVEPHPGTPVQIPSPVTSPITSRSRSNTVDRSRTPTSIPVKASTPTASSPSPRPSPSLTRLPQMKSLPKSPQEGLTHAQPRETPTQSPTLLAPTRFSSPSPVPAASPSSASSIPTPKRSFTATGVVSSPKSQTLSPKLSSPSLTNLSVPTSRHSPALNKPQPQPQTQIRPPARRRNTDATPPSGGAFPLSPPSNPTTNNKYSGRKVDPNSPAEISIARQISLSRKQRQLLVPIGASRSDKLKGEEKPRENPSVRTPTLVVVDDPIAKAGATVKSPNTLAVPSGSIGRARSRTVTAGDNDSKNVNGVLSPNTLVVRGFGPNQTEGRRAIHYREKSQEVVFGNADDDFA